MYGRVEREALTDTMQRIVAETIQERENGRRVWCGISPSSPVLRFLAKGLSTKFAQRLTSVAGFIEQSDPIVSDDSMWDLQTM